jgi:hypothetical protein
MNSDNDIVILKFTRKCDSIFIVAIEIKHLR